MTEKILFPEDRISEAQFTAYMVASRGRTPSRFELVSFAYGDDPIELLLGGFVHRETIKQWSETRIKRF